MTRGAFVAGGGGASLAGCGARRLVSRALGHDTRTCVDTALPSLDGVRIIPGTIDAGRRYACAIALPQRARIDAVVYLLPGRGGTALGALSGIVAPFLAEPSRRGGTPFAIAAIDAGESYFHRRTSGEDRLRAVTVGLRSAAAAALGRRPRAEAIMGQSMGGYGALLAAETYPHRYRAVAVAGPAIFPSYDDERNSVGDAFDSAADFAAHDVVAHAGALRGLPVGVWIGTSDPFLPGVRLFARALPAAQITVAPGCHDDGFWRVHTPAMLAFVGAHL